MAVFRHAALFRWSEDTTRDEVEAIAEGLARLPSSVPELRDYRFGEDAGLVDGNWDFAVVADFDDADGWMAYREHPEHQRVLSEQIRPVAAERAAVQYEA